MKGTKKGIALSLPGHTQYNKFVNMNCKLLKHGCKKT